jgi:hypothetical protein
VETNATDLKFEMLVESEGAGGWDPARSRLCAKERVKCGEYEVRVVRFRKEEREPGGCASLRWKQGQRCGR